MVSAKFILQQSGFRGTPPGMGIWNTIVAILLWPGRTVLGFFPNLGTEEGRLVHNVVNYVVWLSLLCGGLIAILIKTMPTG